MTDPADIQQAHVLSIDEELPVRVIPDVPTWSENYFFYGYDAERRTGFVLLTGRWVKNPALWREQLFLLLPDGSILAHRAIGDRPTANPYAGPSGGTVRTVCDEAGKRWRLEFDGAMQRATLDQFRSGHYVEQVPHSVGFAAEITGASPVMLLPASDNTSYGKYHYEQMIAVSVSFRFGGETYLIEGQGYRDHSRGPRQLGSFDGHVWLQVFMGDGPAFTAYHVWATVDGKRTQILDKATTIGSEGFGPARLCSIDAMTDLAAIEQEIAVVLDIDGERIALRGKPLATLINGFSADYDFYFGAAPDRAEFVSADQPVLLEGDGYRVMAWVQRSMRIG